MPMKAIKLAYIQSLTADNVFAQLKSRLGPKVTKPFKTASKMFNMLTAAFGNPNKKQEARTKYCDLQHGQKEFCAFWAEFLSLSQ